MLKKLAEKACHPGAFLRDDFLPAAKMTQEELARLLGVSVRTVVDLLNERRRVSEAMAARLAKLFGTTPDFWRHFQEKHDALMARQSGEEHENTIGAR
jgi:addiction module HigA family antidote